MKIAAITTFLVTLLLCTTQAHAQTTIDIGPRVGYDIDALNELFVGVDARIGLPAIPVVINPTFDYYFVDGDVTLFQVSANALYNFGINNQVFTPYAGAGVGITRTSVGDVSNTDVGANIIGGASFGFGNLRPFAQAQLTVGGDSDLATLAAGLLFNLSR